MRFLLTVMFHCRAAAERSRECSSSQNQRIDCLPRPETDLTDPPPSYPKHVWSPAGGWYAQPANWKANTAVFGVIIFGITAMVWKMSADKEYRHKMPEQGRFYPSRKYVSTYISVQRRWLTGATVTAGASRSRSTSGRRRKQHCRRRRSHDGDTLAAALSTCTQEEIDGFCTIGYVPSAL